jgi:hypothetical protein
VLAVVAVLFVFGSTVIGVVGGMMTASGAVLALHDRADPRGVGVVAVLATALVRMFGARTGAVVAPRPLRAGQRDDLVPSVSNPPLPGMVFGIGHGRIASDWSAARGRASSSSATMYRTGSGKNESTHRWGYVAVKLSTPLPNIVLDAVGNNGLFGSLPAALDGSQRLSLEGDFDRTFTLYCPSGYEADALYLFTPDIMARFVDHAAALDVEIVDDWLFLYTRARRPLDPPPGPGCSPWWRRCSTSSPSGSAGATSAWPHRRPPPSATREAGDRRHCRSRRPRHPRSTARRRARAARLRRAMGRDHRDRRRC